MAVAVVISRCSCL